MRIPYRILLYVFLTLLLSPTLSSVAPFIPPNAVHRVHSELQFNLIANQNRYSAIIAGVYNKLDKKDIQGLEGMLHNVFTYEPYSGFSLVIDCKKFELDLKGRLGLCDPKDKNSEGVTVLGLFPKSLVLDLKGHEIIGNHDTEVLMDTESIIIAKRIRERLPNFVTEIEDNYDLGEFLKDTQMTKLIYFQESLLNPNYLQKLSGKYHRRVDIGICDNKNIANRHGSQFPSIILLQYNYTSKKYDQYNYTGSTNFQDQPFEDISNFIQQFVLPNRTRDVLMDFELVQQVVFNISDSRLLQKLISQEKMTFVEVRKGDWECSQIKSVVDKYSSMMMYACFNTDQSRFDDIEPGTILLFQDSLSERTIFTPGTSKLQTLVKFPQLLHKVSTQKQSQMCLQLARTNDKLPVLAYYPTASFQSYLMRYLNTLPSFTSIFQFCQVYNPDRFVTKQLSLQDNTLSVLVPGEQQGTSKKVQNKNMHDFGDVKFFLRDLAIAKLVELYEQKIDRNITSVNSPEELTQHCFSKPCVLALLNTQKKSRHDIEIRLLTDLARDFQRQFNVVWTDGNCHKQLFSQVKTKPDQLPVLVYYHEKNNKYSVSAGKYLIKKEVKKWFKWLRSQPKLNRMKYALDIEPRVCGNSEQL